MRIFGTILTLALLCMVPALNAAELRPGVLLGGLISEIGSDPEEDSSSIYNYAGGGYLDYRWKGSEQFGWGLQAQLLLTNRGCTVPETDDAPYKRYELTYIQLPVMARIDFQIGNIIPYLGVGAYGAYNVIAKYAENGDSDDLDDVKRAEVGVIVGNGINWDRFSVNLRYEQALTPFYDEGIELKNIAYTVLLGYAF